MAPKPKTLSEVMRQWPRHTLHSKINYTVINYIFSIHIPLLLGEPAVISVLRLDGPKIAAVALVTVRGRLFHQDIMEEVSRLASEACKIENTTSIQAHLVFSGGAYNAHAIDELLRDRWPVGSYSYSICSAAGGEPRVQNSAKNPTITTPINRYIVPRAAIISCLNLAYAEPGRLVVLLDSGQKEELEGQLNVFTERSARSSTNDPEALMEHKGEGLVIALGIGVWFAYGSSKVLVAWGQDRLDG